MALAKIPDQMETAPITYGPNAEVEQEITEETVLREVRYKNKQLLSISVQNRENVIVKLCYYASYCLTI